MEFPRNNSWEYFDVDSYQRAREAAGASRVPAGPAPWGPPATEADDLLGHLANLQLDNAQRRRACDGAASLAPRTGCDIGGSMRLPASSAALVGRERHIYSARHDLPHVPEPAHSRPALHETRMDAPRRKGGLMSGLKKGLKALGFGGSSRKSSSSSGAGSHSASTAIGSSVRPPRESRRTPDNIRRMESAPPSRSGVQSQLPSMGQEVSLDPSGFRPGPIPTSPGTRRDCESLAHSLGSEYEADLPPFAWTGPTGMPAPAHWHPLPPSPWESAFAHWDAADSALMGSGDASMASHAAHARASLAGPSSSAPAPRQAGYVMRGMGAGLGIEAMENMHRDLFTSPSIAGVEGPHAIWPPVMSTMDVDMDECLVVNATAGEYDSIGTLGVATCFAMCAHGVNDEGETILGLLHHSGVDPQAREVPPRVALERLRDEMQEAGARNVSIHVVGGMSSPLPDYDTLDTEWELLGLRDEFNIRGARLHVNSITDPGEESYVDVLMTAEKVYFSRNRLYD